MESKKPKVTSCDICVYYDYNEDTDSNECQVNLDVDELERFLGRRFNCCPHFKPHDEYKSIRRQN